MPKRKVLEPLDPLQFEGFKNYELSRRGLTPKFNRRDNAKRLIVAIDLDAYADEPRSKRFSGGTLQKIIENAEHIIVQLFSQTKQVRPTRLGAGVHDKRHFEEIDRAKSVCGAVFFVRTTSDRVGYWLAEIGRFEREGARVCLLDGAGAAVVSRRRADDAGF